MLAFLGGHSDALPATEHDVPQYIRVAWRPTCTSRTGEFAHLCGGLCRGSMNEVVQITLADYFSRSLEVSCLERAVQSAQPFCGMQDDG